MSLIIKDSKTKECIDKETVKKAIEENDIVLLLLPNDKYSEKVNDVADVTSKLDGTICYISTNKPYTTLLKNFEKQNINTNNFHFIDCVTKSASGVEAGGKVVCVSSPKALTELNIAIKKALEKCKPKIAIFDSLSTLLIYEDASVVTRFAFIHLQLLVGYYFGCHMFNYHPFLC